MVAVAQLVEHRIVVPSVVGSIPISHPNFALRQSLRASSGQARPLLDAVRITRAKLAPTKSALADEVELSYQLNLFSQETFCSNLRLIRSIRDPHAHRLPTTPQERS